MTQYFTDILISVLAIVLGYATLRYSLGRYIIFVDEKNMILKRFQK